MSFTGRLSTVLTVAQPCILQIIILAGAKKLVRLQPTFTAQTQMQDSCCLVEKTVKPMANYISVSHDLQNP